MSDHERLLAGPLPRAGLALEGGRRGEVAFMSTANWALGIAIISLVVSFIAMWKAGQTGALKQRIEVEAVDHVDAVLSYLQKADSVSEDELRHIRDAKKLAGIVFSKALQSRLDDALAMAERLVPPIMTLSDREALPVLERDLQGIVDQMKDEGAVSAVRAAGRWGRDARTWWLTWWRWMRGTG